MLCQDCWQLLRSDSYPAESHDFGECGNCHEDALLYDEGEDAFDSEALGPCGCTDYHMADCPLIAPDLYENSGDDDDYNPDLYEDEE